MRCFTHILNLVVKVILCQFNVLKAKADKVLDVALQKVVDLAHQQSIMALEKLLKII